MPHSSLLAATGLVVVASAFALPSGTVAQEPAPVIGAIAGGSVSTQPNPNGNRRIFFAGRTRCQEKGKPIASVVHCPGANAYPEWKVTFSVSAATRTKYKLPSTTLAKQQFTNYEFGIWKIFTSTAMSKALGKIKGGSKITIKETASFTVPVVETLTDSVTFTTAKTGYTRGGAWSVRTSNIDDGTTSGGGGKGR